MDNNTKKKIGLNLKAKLLSNALLPVIILFAGLVVAVSFLLKSSLEEETLRGLLASAYSYREAGLVYIDRAEGDNDMENLLKESSSYDYTWFDGSKRKNSSLGESVIGTEATAAVIEEVIQNRKVYTSTKTDVAGEDFFVAYVPVIDSQGKAIGMAFTGVSRESIEAEIMRSIIIMVVIATVIVLVVICTILPSSISMSGAIKEIAEIVNKLEKGIFEESNKYLNRKDEIGDTLRSANSLVGRYKEFATDIKEASGVISSEASELANTSNDISVISNEVTGSAMQISGGADEQVKVIVEVTENITVLSKGIQEVSDYSGELRVTANEMNEAGRYSAEALKKLSKNIAVVENDVTTIAETMADTNQAVLEVSEITDSITNIASQTNLLALNASIEAARAGDAGKGFAVVADEMGMLATSVAQLTKSISSKMSNLLAQAKDSIEKTDRISVNCKNVTEVLKDTDAQITNLLENVEETTHKVNHISARAEECDKSKDVIVDAMTSLTAISQENLALTESTAGSMEEIASRVNLLAEASNKLNEVTEELSNDVGFFKI